MSYEKYSTLVKCTSPDEGDTLELVGSYHQSIREFISRYNQNDLDSDSTDYLTNLVDVDNPNHVIEFNIFSIKDIGMEDMKNFVFVVYDYGSAYGILHPNRACFVICLDTGLEFECEDQDINEKFEGRDVINTLLTGQVPLGWYQESEKDLDMYVELLDCIKGQFPELNKIKSKQKEDGEKPINNGGKSEFPLLSGKNINVESGLRKGRAFIPNRRSVSANIVRYSGNEESDGKV